MLEQDKESPNASLKRSILEVDPDDGSEPMAKARRVSDDDDDSSDCTNSEVGRPTPPGENQAIVRKVSYYGAEESQLHQGLSAVEPIRSRRSDNTLVTADESSEQARTQMTMEETAYQIIPSEPVADLKPLGGHDQGNTVNSEISTVDMVQGDTALTAKDQSLEEAATAESRLLDRVVQNTKSIPGTQSHRRSRKLLLSQFWVRLLLLCTMLLGIRTLGSQSMNRQPIDPNSVFVSGGGFSGFWFSIGRLQSIPDPASKTYYCYSSGCLAVVAALGDCSLDMMVDIAVGVQTRWKEGELQLHDTVEDFLDNFLVTDNVRNLLQNKDLLSRIRVITTVPNGWFGVKSAIRSPFEYNDLHEILVQTTWIPFATGARLWKSDSRSGENHMDGIFSIPDHPVCSHFVGLPKNLELSLDLSLNALNANLSIQKVKKFWTAGLEYGL